MSEFFEDLSGMNLSELDKCEIVDANGEKVGRLIDAVLKKGDDGMKITKFIVGDSKLVELLERLNLRPDIDPVFSIDVIEKVSASIIRLKVAKDELKSTHLDDDVLDSDEYKLTSLSKTPVIDASGDNIGRVIDLVFDKNNFQLILGDSVVTEWAESIGLQSDVDFLIAPSFIESFSKDKITLSKDKKELKNTFIANLDDYKRKADARDAARGDSARYYFPTYM